MPISTVDGVAWASISSFGGVAKANIASVNGVVAEVVPTVTLIGSQLTGATTSVVATLTAGASSGVIVAIALSQATTTPSSAAGSDTGSNTYANQQAVAKSGNGGAIATLVAPITTSLVVGNQVTVSSLPLTTWQLYVYHVTGVASYDVGSSYTATSGTNHNTGTTAPIAGVGTSVAIWTAGSYNSVITDASSGNPLDSANLNSRLFKTFWATVTTGTVVKNYTTAGSTSASASIHVLKP